MKCDPLLHVLQLVKLCSALCSQKNRVEKVGGKRPIPKSVARTLQEINATSCCSNVSLLPESRTEGQGVGIATPRIIMGLLLLFLILLISVYCLFPLHLSNLQ